MAEYDNALDRCGFNAATRNFVTTEGIAGAVGMSEIPLQEFDGMIKGWVRNPNLPANVSFPYVGCHKFKGFKCWIDYRRSRDQPTLAADMVGFDGDIITDFSKRAAKLPTLKETDKADNVPAPDKLTKLDNFDLFEEGLQTYVGSHRSEETGVPLSYLLRSHTEVTDEMLNAEYDSIDDDLIATTNISPDSEQYKRDTKRLFDLLKPLVVDGPGWTFCQSYKRNKEGRKAYLAIKAQAEGTAARHSKKAKAYAIIATASFTGQKGRTNLDTYIHQHQKAHNILKECDEPVPETKKVTDFLTGLTDPRLNTAKSVIHSDAAKLANFEQCQQYVKTIFNNIKISSQAAAGRKIAAVQRKRRPGNKNKPRVRAGHYEADEWRQLTEEEQSKVRKLREEKKKRKAAAANSEVEDGARKLKAVRTEPPPVDSDYEKAKAVLRRHVAAALKAEAKSASVAEADNKEENNSTAAAAAEPNGGNTSAGSQFGRFAHSKDKV